MLSIVNTWIFPNDTAFTKSLHGFREKMAQQMDKRYIRNGEIHRSASSSGISGTGSSSVPECRYFKNKDMQFYLEKKMIICVSPWNCVENSGVKSNSLEQHLNYLKYSALPILIHCVSSGTNETGQLSPMPCSGPAQLIPWKQFLSSPLKKVSISPKCTI